MMDAPTGSMDEMFARAEREGLWFHTGYQDLWFSPGRLRELQSEGRFNWGPVNWTLRHPRERAMQLEQEARAARDRANNFARLLP